MVYSSPQGGKNLNKQIEIVQCQKKVGHLLTTEDNRNNVWKATVKVSYGSLPKLLHQSKSSGGKPEKPSH